MVEKFEASKRDVEIFRSVEKELFDIMVLWSNVFQGVPPEIGLKEDLNVASINDDAYVDIVFNKPEMIRTKSEQEDSIIKRLNEGLMSKVEAISELREIDEDAAKEVIEKIKEDQMDLVPGFALKAVSDQQQKDMEEEEDGGTEGQGAV
jgi:urease alpha subunit